MTLLGWFVAVMTVKGLALLALGITADRLLRRAPSALRISAWQVIFVGLLALPLGMVTLPGWEVIPRPTAGWMDELFRGTIPLAGTTQSAADLGGEVSLYLSWEGQPGRGYLTDAGGEPYTQLSQPRGARSLLLRPGADPFSKLFLFWLAGVLVLLSRSGVALARLAGLRRRAQLITEPTILAELEEACRGVAAPGDRLRLLTTGEVHVPVTWGIRRPVVALPERMLGAPSPILQSVLRHELVHVRRRSWAGAQSFLVIPALFMGTAVAVACADLRPLPEPVPGMPTAISQFPLFEVGVREGAPEEEFHEVVTPFRMPDGRLVVPQRGSAVIRIFSPEGGGALRLGGQGEGPGEFLSLSQAWARGDTVEAFDGILGRVTRFHPDGSVQVVTLERLPGVQGAVPDPIPDGWLTVGVASGGTGVRDEVVIRRFDLQGGHVGEVARLPAMERTTYPSGGAGPAPLTPRAQVQAWGDRIFVGETLTPRLQVLSLSGEEEAHLSWESPPTLEPAEALARLRVAAEGHLGPDRDPMNQLVMAALDVDPPARISSFWSLLVDPYGFLWIRDYDPALHGVGAGGLASPSGYLMGGSGPGGSWRVFSPDGEEVGTVTVPAELELMRVEGDGIVGIHRDGLGVESVRVHALERR